MPIDWGTTLGAIDQDTASMLARRQLEQQGLMNVLKEQDALRTSASTRATNEEAKKANAALTRAKTEETNQQIADKLGAATPIGADVTNDPEFQKAMVAAHRGSALKSTPGVAPTTIAPVTAAANIGEGLPGADLEGNAAPAAPVTEIQTIEAAKQQSGEKPKVMYQGTKKDIYEQERVKAISDYTDAVQAGDDDEVKRLRGVLQLKYNLKTTAFGDGQHILNVGADGKIVDLGVVPEGAKVHYSTATGAGGAEIDPDVAKTLAATIVRQGSFKGTPLQARGALGSPMGIQVSKIMGDMIRSGEFSPDFATSSALYDGAKANYKTMYQKVALTNTAALTAADAIKLADDASEKIGSQVFRTNSSWINEHFQEWMKGAVPAPDLSDLEIKALTAAREYVKVVSGSAQSVAEVSPAARAQIDKLLNSARSPADFRAVTEAMGQDMALVIRNNVSALNDVRSTIENTGRLVGGQTATPALGTVDIMERIHGTKPAAATAAAPAAPVTPAAPTDSKGATNLAPAGSYITDGKGNFRYTEVERAIPAGWSPYTGPVKK